MNKSYNIVTCASFGSSGSSVITDYLSEYSDVKNLGTYEFRFIQDYYGLGTLEDALVHSPHRLNSDIAIQNFLRYVDRQCGNFINRRYQKYFDNKWREISCQFIERLIDVEWNGYWEEYQIIEPKYYAILKYQILPRVKRFLSLNKKYIAHYVPRKKMFFSFPSEEFFLKCAKEYTHKLCLTIDPKHQYRYLVLDQIMPPANIGKYERYFYSIKTIVVDRDPRDYYIENVLRWGEGWVPKDVNKFAVLYRKQREQTDVFKDSTNVLRIQFEDSIFHYDDFEKSVSDFLELDSEKHIRPFGLFNPSKSVKNTRLWNKRNIDSALIHRIEELLPEYLYDFDANLADLNKNNDGKSTT